MIEELIDFKIRDLKPHPAFYAKNKFTCGLSVIGQHVAKLFDTVGHMRTDFGGSREQPSTDSRSIAIHQFFSHITNVCFVDPTLPVDDNSIMQSVRKSHENEQVEINKRDHVWCLLKIATQNCGTQIYIEDPRPSTNRSVISPARWLMLMTACLFKGGFTGKYAKIDVLSDHALSNFINQFANFRFTDGRALAILPPNEKIKITTEERQTAKQIACIRASLNGIRGTLANMKSSWELLELPNEMKEVPAYYAAVEWYAYTAADLLKTTKSEAGESQNPQRNHIAQPVYSERLAA